MGHSGKVKVTLWNAAGMALVLAGLGCSPESADEGYSPAPPTGGGLLAGGAAPAPIPEATSPLVHAPPAPTSTQASGPSPVANGGAAPVASPPSAGTWPVPASSSSPAVGAGAHAGAMPCAVDQVVTSNCGVCHGATPIGGAIKLTDVQDWHRMSPLYDPTKRVYEVAKIRINDGSMPQGGAMSGQPLAVLNDWLAKGAPAAEPTEATCGAAPAPTVKPDNGKGYGTGCDRPGAFDPLVAREEGEVCWSFRVHGAAGANDTSKFAVDAGESYHEFYYDVPWPNDHVGTRFFADFDNLQVLHHYLVFSSGAIGKVPGQIDRNVLGTTLGTNSELIAGWAVGGCSQEAPPNVGLELNPQGLIMIQWHMYNTTGAHQMDGSAVQICTIPRTQRDEVAGITFLGTENLHENGLFGGMSPGEHTFTTTCTNNSGKPITILNFTPHMHLIGKRMTTKLQRLDGTEQVIFDEPFQFDYQIGWVTYEPRPVVMPGEKLVTSCTFFNDTTGYVAFGESTDTEMCYQFVSSYPAGALDNGVFSLIGATNTCW